MRVGISGSNCPVSNSPESSAPLLFSWQPHCFCSSYPVRWPRTAKLGKLELGSWAFWEQVLLEGLWEMKSLRMVILLRPPRCLLPITAMDHWELAISDGRDCQQALVFGWWPWFLRLGSKIHSQFFQRKVLVIDFLCSDSLSPIS